VPLTFVPPLPVLPSESSWMRQPKTDIPGLVLNRRVAFLPADIDRAVRARQLAGSRRPAGQPGAAGSE
jgi:hypothetical protein